jgi:hypothetical protein
MTCKHNWIPADFPNEPANYHRFVCSRCHHLATALLKPHPKEPQP